MSLRPFQSTARSPWLLAILPSVISFLLMDKPVRPYTFTLEDFNHQRAELMAFEDLNGDGLVEWISARKDIASGTYPAKIAIGKSDLDYFKSLEQINLVDDIVENLSNLSFGDYDNDSAKEIYIFTQRNDSIFLNEIELFDAAGLRQDRHFITRFGKERADHLTLFVCGLFDGDNDGSQELYFAINSGFGLWPRLVYCYDFAKDVVSKSPYTSINLGDAQMSDIDGDGRPEIYGSNGASGNHHFPTPFSDYWTWVMVYDDQLRFKFKPLGFEGFGNWNKALPVQSLKFQGMIVLFNANEATSKDSSQLLLMDVKGNIFKRKLLSELGVKRAGNVAVFRFRDEDHAFIFCIDRILIVNADLSIVKEWVWESSEFENPSELLQFDFDLDGQMEFVVLNATYDKIAFADAEGSLLDVIRLPNEAERIKVSTYANQTERKLFLKSMSYAGFISVDRNKYYWTSYLAFPAIYAAFVFLTAVIQRITTRQVMKREEAKRRLQDLQLQSIKAQLGPHFIFNALNAIGSMIKLEDPDAAYDYLAKFTRLLRKTLEDADKIWRPLHEEIEFVAAYLDLEKMRFGEKFEYRIVQGQDLTQNELVPVMCIQIFAENAVRHGIMPYDKGGEISISVQRRQSALEIRIKDNGVGRGQASRSNDGLGKGLRMLREFYGVINSSGMARVEFTLHDVDDSDPVGTEVVLKVVGPKLGMGEDFTRDENGP